MDIKNNSSTSQPWRCLLDAALLLLPFVLEHLGFGSVCRLDTEGAPSYHLLGHTLDHVVPVDLLALVFGSVYRFDAEEAPSYHLLGHKLDHVFPIDW